MHKNQNGFSPIWILLLILILVGAGFAGWRVWKSSSDDSSDVGTSETSPPPAESTEPEPVDPTADWVEYSNVEGDYSFKHPDTWVQTSNPEKCSGGLALFASTNAALGKCASESGGQMQFSSTAGDVRTEYAFDESYYTDTTESAVTVGGVTGQKLTATVAGMQAETMIGGYPDDTELVRYMFFTKGRTYIASYVQEPTYPDALSDFNLLVTKTFKFSK